MQFPVQIKSTLISVYYKDKLEPIIRKLNQLGVTIYSTGGTEKFIRDLHIPVEAVEDLTSYPSILGGRVKTLHPKVFGGILARRENQQDVLQMEQYALPSLDLVIVDLYPFEETMRSSKDETEIIEKIDIGGVSLIRAAAKNFHDVLIISSKEDYDDLLHILENNNGISFLHERKKFAKKAFNTTAKYDTCIYNYFLDEKTGDNLFRLSDYSPRTDLRYGENPHQHASFYGELDKVFRKIQGKEISYNNLVDIEAAIYLLEEFKQQYSETGEPTFAILKHTNACGIATASTVSEAYSRAFSADPMSAFGGVLICNTPIDKQSAEKINALFFEVIIAPSYSFDALEILQTKKNRIILEQTLFQFPNFQFKSLLNGVLEQDRNVKSTNREELKWVTKKQPSENEIEDLLFAEKVVKHLKSNGIALVKNKQLLACGTGQTSRVDALKQAIIKAKQFNFELKDAVMASEAFFPFPDCVEIAHAEGINAVIQPGGSIKDNDSILYCDAHNMTMVITGTRHFKH